MKKINYNQNNFFVLTGGPGAGKTSLIEQLRKEGLLTVNESGRRIIQHQQQIGGEALPWKNQTLFAQHMLAADIKNYQGHLSVETPVIFDRGIPDILGYTRLCKIRPIATLTESVKRYRYHPLIFILPPWRAIYQQDTERKQDFSLAVETYRMMYKTYASCGYKLVTIPKITVEERAISILQYIQKWSVLTNNK